MRYYVVKRHFLQLTTLFKQLLIFLNYVSYYSHIIIHLEGLISHQ